MQPSVPCSLFFFFIALTMLINADFNWIVELQVDVGDFLRLKSCVLYTETENLEQPRIHVEVIAHVTQPELKSSEVLL